MIMNNEGKKPSSQLEKNFKSQDGFSKNKTSEFKGEGTFNQQNSGKGFQSGEVRKRSVPGTRDLIMEIKSLSDKISAIDLEIKQVQDQIYNIVSEERSKSPRNQLMNDLKAAIDEKKFLSNERKNLFDLNLSSKSEIESIRSEKGKSATGMNNIGKINKSIEDLEYRLISTKLSPKEESEIAANLSAFKVQKNKLGELEAKFARAEELEQIFKDNKVKIGELTKQLNEKNVIIDNLKAELEKLNETGKTKSPAVARFETKVDALKNQRNEHFTQRNVKRENVHTLEEEYAKLESEILIQKQLEEQKDVIRKNINNFKFERDSLMGEKEAYNPKVFDTIILSLNKLKGSQGFSLDIDLVTHLLKHGVQIPSSLETLDMTIKSLQQKKEKSSSELKGKIDSLSIEVAVINAKIDEETNRLNLLPPTNIDLLKKGGFRNKL